ncbi:MAG: hypothetical protein J5J06_04025, partial [Phycisphaerae bacterium]|nr:hypothetical protein [Phycisphaerae bacterium]
SRPKIVVLEHAKVNQVLPVLQDMFGEKGRGGGASRSKGQAPPVITANAALNALIVRAGPTDMAVIEDVVAGLDTQRVAEVKQFRVVQLAPGLDLDQLADTVEQNINESAMRQAPTGSNQQEVPSITVSTDPRSSSLIIGGSPQLFDPAEELAREVEKLAPQGSLVTTVIRTENLSQDEVEALIDKLTNPSPGNERSGSRSRSRPSRPTSRPRGR